MSDPIDRLALAYAARCKQAMEMWMELKSDHMNQPKLMRRYCACLRLCGWLQKQIKSLA